MARMMAFNGGKYVHLAKNLLQEKKQCRFPANFSVGSLIPGFLADRLRRRRFQGNLYVFYHVPESQTNTDSTANYLVKYGADGKELARENISWLTRQFSPYETAVDAKGRIYLMGIDRLIQFDGECNYIGAAESFEEERLIWLAGDDGGHVYCCLSDDRTYRGIIREVVHDIEASRDDQSASPEGSQSAVLKDAPIAFMGSVIGEFQAGNHLTAYGENRFLTSMGNTLYLYDAAAKEARTALHLDISSGQCPDILVLEYDDLETYASKGLFEDLSPYLEKNAHLEISDNVLESYTLHGKLCALPGALQIRTIVGRTESLGQLGGKSSWTLEEMMDFIDSHPDKTAFSTDAGQLLEYCLTFNQSHFVDREAHTCDFTSDEFKRLLEFCGRFSGKQADDEKSVLNLMGRGNSALLHEVELVRPEDISLLMQILGTSDISYIGFPTIDGQIGILLEDCGGTCAISAKSGHKDEAWAFLEILLTRWENPPQSFSALLGTKGFPTELGTREQYFAKVVENPYVMQEDGDIRMVSGKPVRTYHHALAQNGQQVHFYVPPP